MYHTVAVYSVTWPDGQVDRLETKDGHVKYASGYCRGCLLSSIDVARAVLGGFGAKIMRTDDRLASGSGQRPQDP
jgi:hypothetical protein